MKALRGLTCLLLGLSLLSGCGKPEPKELSIADYFPIIDNVRYDFESIKDPSVKYRIFVEFTGSNRVQRRFVTSDYSSTEVIEVGNDRIQVLFSYFNINFKASFLEQSNMMLVLLKEPIEVGQIWYDGITTKHEILSINAPLTTPYGEFETIEVKTSESDSPNNYLLNYYAKDIGLVKLVSITDGEEDGYVLTDITKPAMQVESVEFFYPDLLHDQIVSQTREISTMTNEYTHWRFLTEYKKAPEVGSPVFSAQATILDVGLTEDTVIINLGSEFIEGLTVDEAAERMILQCIANTYGNYFMMTKVSFRVEGVAYVSDNLSLELSEVFTVTAPTQK